MSYDAQKVTYQEIAHQTDASAIAAISRLDQ